MKAQILRVVAIIVVLIAGTITSVRAQSSHLVAVNIPFEFNVRGKTLPPGKYLVRRALHWIPESLVITDETGRSAAALVTMQVETRMPQTEGKLVFNKYGEQYFLSQIWEAGESAGRALTKSKRERSLERQTEKIAMTRETVTLIARH